MRDHSDCICRPARLTEEEILCDLEIANTIAPFEWHRMTTGGASQRLSLYDRCDRLRISLSAHGLLLHGSTMNIIKYESSLPHPFEVATHSIWIFMLHRSP